MIVPGYNQLIQAVKSNFIAWRCFTAVPLNTQILAQVTQQHWQIFVMLTAKIFEHYDARWGFWILDLSKTKPEQTTGTSVSAWSIHQQLHQSLKLTHCQLSFSPSHLPQQAVRNSDLILTVPFCVNSRGASNFFLSSTTGSERLSGTIFQAFRRTSWAEKSTRSS